MGVLPAEGLRRADNGIVQRKSCCHILHLTCHLHFLDGLQLTDGSIVAVRKRICSGFWRVVFHSQLLRQRHAVVHLIACRQSGECGSLCHVVAFLVNPRDLRLCCYVLSVSSQHRQDYRLRLRQGCKSDADVLVLHLYIVYLSEDVAPLIAQHDVPRRIADDVGKSILRAVGHHIVHALTVLRVGQFQPHLRIVSTIDAFRQVNGDATDILLNGQNGKVLPPVSILILADGSSGNIHHESFRDVGENLSVKRRRSHGINNE